MKLLVFDANSIVNRAFYGIRLLSTKDGVFTNGIYGFINILNREIEEEKPDVVVAAFDLSAPTFRHKQYTEYKAGRKPMPEELAMQIPLLKEILDKRGVLCLEKEGYEADDIIGTIAKHCENTEDTCVVITGDKDDLQLVTDSTVCKLTVTRMQQNEVKAYTPQLFFEQYGYEPQKIIDLKALWGDSSDNIPGVPGIGEKTASDLIKRFGTIEEIYENIDSPDIKDSVRKKLTEGKESAFHSKELATIYKEVPLNFDFVKYANNTPDYAGLFEIYTQLELRTFAEKIRPFVNKIEKTEQKHIDCETLEIASVFQLQGITDSFSEIAISADDSQFCIYDGKLCYVLNSLTLGGDYHNAVQTVISSKAKKTVHDIKSLMKLYGEIDKSTVVFDTMLAAYLINPAASNYSVYGLIGEYLGKSTEENSKAACQCLLSLKDKLLTQLKNYNMEKLYYEIELPLAFVLYSMEKEGFKVDREALVKYGETLVGDLKELSSLIYDFAGEEFNINSPKQLGVILFEKLHIPGGKKSKSGAYKTDADTLDKLKKTYPIVDLILKYRQLSKLYSTYAEGLLKVIEEDGRIHTTFNQTVTITGRISSTEPNLQNIPIRTEVGRELRKMFVAKEGCVLLDADYSQIELRVLADISDDKTMIDAFKSGDDIHAITASQVFGVPLNEVTSTQRSNAKAVNFGIVYGISAFSLADDIGVTNKEAKAYIDAYFNKYNKVHEYLENTVKKAKEDGFVTTAFNRHRFLPEIKSSNFIMRSFGERVAMNTPIQGTAADIIKLAMVKVYDRLIKEDFKAKLILQVHDELIIECPVEETKAVSALLKEEMENAVTLKVPMSAEVGQGASWYDAK